VIGYDRQGRAFGWVLIALGLVEIAVIEVLVPWPVARVVLAALGALSVLLVVAFLADAAVRPHVLTADDLRLRAGVFGDVTVPLRAIDTVRRRTATAEGFVVVSDDMLSLAVGTDTQVELSLHEALDLAVGSRSGRVRFVRFCADDPVGAVPMISSAVRAAGSGR